MTDQSAEFLKRFQKIKHNAIRKAYSSTLKFTIQFFYDNVKGDPSPTGSGLLLKFNNRFFMLTAAHVIAEDYNDLFIILPEKELRLGGQLFSTPLPPSGRREDDKIDIAVLELNNETVKEIGEDFSYISVDEIGLSHKCIIDQQKYLTVGYPASKTKKIWNKDEISALLYPYVSEVADDFDYKRFGFSKNTHIAIRFDGYITYLNNDNKQIAPKLNGISGCGLWYLDNFPSTDQDKNKLLIGFILERRREEGNKALVATRIDLVTEFIRQHFNANVPKSKTIKVNFDFKPKI